MYIPEGSSVRCSTSSSYTSYIERVQIPGSATEIGNYAFYNCKYLTDIYYALSEEDWNRITNVSSIDESVTIHYNSTALSGLLIVPSEITLTTGKRIMVQAVGKNIAGIKENDTAAWSINNDLSGGYARIISTSTCDGKFLCQIEGVKEGTCSLTVNTINGYSATAAVNVVTDVKKTVSTSGIQTHLSGSQNYVMEDTDSGTLDLESPIKSEVLIKSQSAYTTEKKITIKKGGVLRVEGTLEAKEIIIRGGGRLEVSGRVNAKSVTAEGNIFAEAGTLSISGVLKANTVYIKSGGSLSLQNGQLIATESFKYSGDTPGMLEGLLFIGRSMSVNKHFQDPDGKLNTIFYGDTSEGKFSFHKQSIIGNVFAENEEKFKEIGIGVENRISALQFDPDSVIQNDPGRWSYSPGTRELTESWEEGLGGYYQNIIKETQTAALLSSYRGLTDEDCKFITNLAILWVGSICPQINSGIFEFSSDSYDMYFRLKGNRYRLRFEQSTYGAFGTFGEISLCLDDDEDSEVVFGASAAGSIENFKAQAVAYLAEQSVQQYYKFVTGSLPKAASADTLKDLLKERGVTLVEKYVDKMISKCLFQTSDETDYGKETARIKQTFDLQELLWDGDLGGLWGFAKDAVKDETENSGDNSAVPLIDEAEETEANNAMRDVSDTVVDEFLKAALIEVLGEDSEGEPDFAKSGSVKFLDLSGKYIQELDGIQYFDNLTTLILGDNEISDLTPLASLTKLKYLDVSGQSIQDISCLAGLTRMEILNLSDNPIDSVAGVSGMTQLRELDIADTDVSSLSPLSSLGNLKILRASNLPLEDPDLMHLKKLSSLTEVYVSDCGLERLDGINVSALVTLDVSDNGVSDLTPITQAAKLQSLNASENMVETVPSLKNCSALTKLDLSGNFLMDLSGLAGAPALTELDVSSCELVNKDVEALAKIRSLVTLDISSNNLRDISDLFVLENLRTLDISKTGIELADYSDLPQTVNFVDSDIVRSGVCKDGLKWMIDRSGKLSIYGKGTMQSYKGENVPWPKASSVRIGEGIINAGDYVFANRSPLIRVQLPSTLTTIGAHAFYGCNILEGLTVPANVTEIGEQAIYNEATTVYYVGYKNEWDELEKGKGLKYKEVIYDEEPLPDTLPLPEDITISPAGAVYSGTAHTPDVVISDSGKALEEGTDYTVAYLNNVNPGEATITITGIGKYTGTVTRTFMILPGKTTRGDMFNLANNVKVTWKEVPGAAYYKVYREGVTDPSESVEEPVIVTTGLIGWDKQPGLTNGHAYRYKIVASLTGAGDSSGDSPLSYSKLMYRLKTVVIRSVKNTAPGKVTVKYDKTTSGDSYVLQYCERQDMVGAKTKVVLGAANTSYVIGGLKKGKTYYISIRVRKKVNGIDYYTTFGVAKKVTITK